jgi:hypothetical protein
MEVVSAMTTNNNGESENALTDIFVYSKLWLMISIVHILLIIDNYFSQWTIGDYKSKRSIHKDSKLQVQCPDNNEVILLRHYVIKKIVSFSDIQSFYQ